MKSEVVQQIWAICEYRLDKNMSNGFQIMRLRHKHPLQPSRKPQSLQKKYRTGWSRGNALDLYLGGAPFESGRKTGYPQVVPGFPRYLWANAGIVTQLSHDCFLPSPLPFTIHLSSYPTQYSLDTERAAQITHGKNTEKCSQTVAAWANKDFAVS
jgi:hypothetical protein